MENFDIILTAVKGEILKRESIINIALTDDELKAEVYYSLKKEPLVLRAKANENDNIKLRFYPYRLELYVNGILCDEEWPFGEALIKENPEFNKLAKEFTEDKKEVPSVIAEFTNAEGWRPEENVYVGDCMPYTYGGRYHVLYLKDRHNHRSKWGKGAHQWEHISTNDFEKWQIHPMAVEIDDPMEGSICTGSFIPVGDKQYLYYTVRMSDGSSAPIMRSVSEDGYHFKKDKGFNFRLSDKYTGESARDPKVVCDENGIYHMFVTTTLKSENKGCLVHLTSKDTDRWAEESVPIYIAETADEPECSDYFKYKDCYYLIFSLRGRGMYLYSKEPFSNWKTPKDPYIPCRTVPKASIFEDKIIFTGYKNIFEGLYAGTMTFKEADVDENGEMIFK